MIVNIAEAKANLSKLINRALHGERIVIAKNNTPLVDLVVHQPEARRQLGLVSGELSIPEDFDAEDEEVNRSFYGESN